MTALPIPDLPPRTAIYCRISRDATGQAAGVERQENLCRELAVELGWEVEYVLVDNDISAFSGKRRPAYEQLITLIETDQVDAVLAYHTDRMYRRVIDLVSLTEVLQRHPVQVRTVQGGDIDLSSANGVMQAQMSGVLAQHESARTGERVSAKKREQAQKGLHVSGGERPFGFDRVPGQPGHLVINEPEAEIIREMAAKALAPNTSMRSLVHELNDRGVTTVGGNHWRDQALRKILTSPRIAGLVPYGGEAVAEAQWPAIIPREQWERLCVALAHQRRGRKPRSFLLSGFVYCGREGCGYRLHSHTGTRKDGSQRRRYRCETDVDPGACGSLVVEAANVESEVVSRVLVIARGQNLADVQAERSQSETHRLAAALADDEELLGQFADDVGQRRISRAEFFKLRDPIEARIKANRAALQMINEASQLPEHLSRIDHTKFADLEFNEKRAVLRVFVDRIYVDPAKRRGQFDPDRVRIEWRA